MSALGLSSEDCKGLPNSCRKHVEQSQALPYEPFNILKLHLAVRLAVLQRPILISLKALPGAGGIVPQTKAMAVLPWLIAWLQHPPLHVSQRPCVETPGPPVEHPDVNFTSSFPLCSFMFQPPNRNKITSHSYLLHP